MISLNLPAAGLRAVLPGLARVAGRSRAFPVLASLRAVGAPDGSVSLQATDLDSHLTARVAGAAGTPGELLVPLADLQQAVKAARSLESVTLVRDGGRTLLRQHLAGHVVEQSVTAPDPAEWPAPPPVAGPATGLDEAACEALARAFACCSVQTGREAIAGAWLDVTDPQAHYVLGTDGRHLYAANSLRLGLPQPVLLPQGRFLGPALLREPGPWTLMVQPGTKDDPGRLLLESPRWTFVTRRPDHPVPQWRRVVPDQPRTVVVLGAEAAARLRDILPGLPGREDANQPVRLEIRGGRLAVTARDRASADTAALPVPEAVVTGPDLSVGVNRAHLLKALAWGLLRLELTDAFTAMVFSDAGRRLVVMPVRTGDPVPDQNPETSPEPSPEPSPETQPEPPSEAMPEPSSPAAAAPPGHRLPAADAAPAHPAARPSFRLLGEQVEAARDQARTLSRHLAGLLDGLRQLEKDRRAGEREVQQVRDRLRALQGVRL